MRVRIERHSARADGLRGLVLFRKRLVVGLFAVSLIFRTGGSSGTDLPCSVCAGVRCADPTVTLDALATEPKLGEHAAFFVAWTLPLDGTADLQFIDKVRRAGAKPWIRVVFRTPQPIADHFDRLEAELEELATLVRRGGDGLFVQAVWLPAGGTIDVRDHAFLIKRAAVAVTGASLGASFIAGPFEADPDSLRALYREEIAVYLDLVALAPDGDMTTAIDALAALDPGKPVVLDALQMSESPQKTVARVAKFAAAGFAVVFFEADAVKPANLNPLKTMARTFRGNLVFDPDSSPSGADASWAFLREDPVSYTHLRAHET